MEHKKIFFFVGEVTFTGGSRASLSFRGGSDRACRLPKRRIVIDVLPFLSFNCRWSSGSDFYASENYLTHWTNVHLLRSGRWVGSREPKRQDESLKYQVSSNQERNAARGVHFYIFGTATFSHIMEWDFKCLWHKWRQCAWTSRQPYPTDASKCRRLGRPSPSWNFPRSPCEIFSDQGKILLAIIRRASESCRTKKNPNKLPCER